MQTAPYDRDVNGGPSLDLVEGALSEISPALPKQLDLAGDLPRREKIVGIEELYELAHRDCKPVVSCTRWTAASASDDGGRERPREGSCDFRGGVSRSIIHDDDLDRAVLLASDALERGSNPGRGVPSRDYH